jgi:AAHS family 4-hydroxybenzoate transporter-like MFS transporter
MSIIVFAAWVLTSFDMTMVGIAGPALTKALGISASTLLYTTSFLGIATLLASLVAGLLLDRFGRKPVFQWATLGIAVFSGLVALVTSFWQFVILRFMANTTQGGILPSANTIVAEEASPKLRGRLQGLALAGYALGSALAGTIAAVILAHFGWRALFLFAFIPMLLVLLISRYLRETPRYLASKAETTVAARSDHRFTLTSLREVFAPGYRVQTALLLVYGFCPAGLAIFVSIVMPFYLADTQGLSLASVATLIGLDFYASIIGNFVAAAFVNYISPKLVLIAFPLIGACLFLPIFVPHAGYGLILLALVGTGFFSQGVYATYAVYVPSVYPAHIRGRATGVVFVGTGISSVVLPLVGAVLLEIANPLPIPILTICIPVIALVAALFLKSVPVGRDLDAAAEELT